MAEPLPLESHALTTADGWQLPLLRAIWPGGPSRGKPVLLVPGYGMNSLIFHHHPRGTPLMGALLRAGFDPWTVDLRGAKATQALPYAAAPRLADQAWVDLPAAIRYVLDRSGWSTLDAIGCSLGGTLLYALVGRRDAPIDRLVTMGSPLVWEDRSLLVRMFGHLAPMAAHIPVRGTRPAARVALPILGRIAPVLLSMYVNPRLTALHGSEQLVQGIENPIADVTARLGAWIREGHLRLDGHNVTDGLARFRKPLLVVYATGDGIVPPPTALAALRAVSGPADTLEVHHPQHRVSHVDLFLADLAPTHVYPGVAGWLQSA